MANNELVAGWKKRAFAQNEGGTSSHVSKASFREVNYGRLSK